MDESAMRGAAALEAKRDQEDQELIETAKQKKVKTQEDQRRSIQDIRNDTERSIQQTHEAAATKADMAQKQYEQDKAAVQCLHDKQMREMKEKHQENMQNMRAQAEAEVNLRCQTLRLREAERIDAAGIDHDLKISEIELALEADKQRFQAARKDEDEPQQRPCTSIPAMEHVTIPTGPRRWKAEVEQKQSPQTSLLGVEHATTPRGPRRGREPSYSANRPRSLSSFQSASLHSEPRRQEEDRGRVGFSSNSHHPTRGHDESQWVSRSSKQRERITDRDFSDRDRQDHRPRHSLLRNSPEDYWKHRPRVDDSRYRDYDRHRHNDRQDYRRQSRDVHSRPAGHAHGTEYHSSYMDDRRNRDDEDNNRLDNQDPFQDYHTPKSSDHCDSYRPHYDASVSRGSSRSCHRAQSSFDTHDQDLPQLRRESRDVSPFQTKTRNVPGSGSSRSAHEPRATPLGSPLPRFSSIARVPLGPSSRGQTPAKGMHSSGQNKMLDSPDSTEFGWYPEKGASSREVAQHSSFSQPNNSVGQDDAQTRSPGRCKLWPSSSDEKGLGSPSSTTSKKREEASKGKGKHFSFVDLSQTPVKTASSPSPVKCSTKLKDSVAPVASMIKSPRVTQQSPVTDNASLPSPTALTATNSHKKPTIPGTKKKVEFYMIDQSMSVTEKPRVTPTKKSDIFAIAPDYSAGSAFAGTLQITPSTSVKTQKQGTSSGKKSKDLQRVLHDPNIDGTRRFPMPERRAASTATAASSEPGRAASGEKRKTPHGETEKEKSAATETIKKAKPVQDEVKEQRVTSSKKDSGRRNHANSDLKTPSNGLLQLSGMGKGTKFDIESVVYFRDDKTKKEWLQAQEKSRVYLKMENGVYGPYTDTQNVSTPMRAMYREWFFPAREIQRVRYCPSQAKVQVTRTKPTDHTGQAMNAGVDIFFGFQSVRELTRFLQSLPHHVTQQEMKNVSILWGHSL